MDIEEYNRKKKELKKEADRNLFLLNKAFALSNNKVEIGDIVTDHCRTLVVEKILISTGYSGVPECGYRGSVLTKSLKKRKDGRVETVFQSNMISHRPSSNNNQTG